MAHDSKATACYANNLIPQGNIFVQYNSVPGSPVVSIPVASAPRLPIEDTLWYDTHWFHVRERIDIFRNLVKEIVEAYPDLPASVLKTLVKALMQNDHINGDGNYYERIGTAQDLYYFPVIIYYQADLAIAQYAQYDLTKQHTQIHQAFKAVRSQLNKLTDKRAKELKQQAQEQNKAIMLEKIKNEPNFLTAFNKSKERWNSQDIQTFWREQLAFNLDLPHDPDALVEAVRARTQKFVMV